MWITTNCGKFWKRWDYQTTWPASWEIWKKQQLETCNNRLVPNWERSTSRLYIVTAYKHSTGCCLSNLHAEYIIWNARLDEAQAGIKTAKFSFWTLDTSWKDELPTLANGWLDIPDQQKVGDVHWICVTAHLIKCVCFLSMPPASALFLPVSCLSSCENKDVFYKGFSLGNHLVPLSLWSTYLNQSLQAPHFIFFLLLFGTSV